MNYVISERDVDRAARSVSANQIIHLRPICGQDVFSRFLDANPFVREFTRTSKGRFGALESLSHRAWPGADADRERRARWLCGWHLRRRAATWQSRDQVKLEPECLKLHTSSHRASILARFDRAMLDALQRVDEDSRCEVIASGS